MPAPEAYDVRPAWMIAATERLEAEETDAARRRIEKRQAKHSMSKTEDLVQRTTDCPSQCQSLQLIVDDDESARSDDKSNHNSSHERFQIACDQLPDDSMMRPLGFQRISKRVDGYTSTLRAQRLANTELDIDFAACFTHGVSDPNARLFDQIAEEAKKRMRESCRRATERSSKSEPTFLTRQGSCGPESDDEETSLSISSKQSLLELRSDCFTELDRLRKNVENMRDKYKALHQDQYGLAAPRA
jgi:hypothetical protein